MSEPQNPDMEGGPDQGPPAVDLKGALKLVSDQAFPLEVGHVEVSDCGQIKARDKTAPVTFTFAYHGVQFEAAFVPEQGATLTVSANLGRLPYTAECGEARWLLLRLVRTASALPHGRLTLNAADEIVYQAEATPPSPRTPVSLMACITAVMLDLKPYLDIFGETLKRPATAASG